MDINSVAVLKEEGATWIFLLFKASLVDGHYEFDVCIVLSKKAQEKDCHPEIILDRRRLNDSIGRICELMIEKE